MSTEINTEHPYIVQQETAAGVEPHIRGTDIAVRHVVGQYRHYGTIEGVLNAYPHLTAAQVHDALSYYYDHIDEIESHSQANAEEVWENKDRQVPSVVSGFRSRELEWRRTHPEALGAFANEWVALEGEQIVAHGKDALQVVAEARARGIQTPYVFFVESPHEDVIKMGL